EDAAERSLASHLRVVSDPRAVALGFRALTNRVNVGLGHPLDNRLAVLHFHESIGTEQVPLCRSSFLGPYPRLVNRRQTVAEVEFKYVAFEHRICSGLDDLG